MILTILTGAAGVVLGTWVCRKIWGPAVTAMLEADFRRHF